MNENLVRGYAILGTISHIEKVYDQTQRDRIYGTLSPEVRSHLGSYKPVEWYDRSHWVDLLKGIVVLYPTEAEAYKALVECGEAVADMATNTFLKLLIRMLTPGLFAKKIPDIWRRDNKCGRFEADTTHIDQKKLVMHLLEMEGYDHIGPVAVGWISFAMGRMGKKGVNSKLSGWSLQAPGPDRMRVDVSWQ